MQDRKRDGGLVLVCGPTSSGKSTTLAAMVEEYCREIGGRAVTLEDPIEYPFNQPYHFVTQREVGVEVPTWEDGIMGALRERIDLLMIGELRTAASIRAALQASAAGFFVIASIHVMRIHELPERIALEFSADEYENIRKKLASSLKLVIGQRLLPGLHGTALLYEMLSLDRKAKLAFARGSSNEIAECINDASNKLNMSFDRGLEYLYHSGQINHEVFAEWKQVDI
jgi:twitching motility protein PilT